MVEVRDRLFGLSDTQTPPSNITSLVDALRVVIVYATTSSMDVEADNEQTFVIVAMSVSTKHSTCYDKRFCQLPKIFTQMGCRVLAAYRYKRRRTFVDS